MKYWWVNQNQTFEAEVQGGFLWSPKANRDGRRNPFYDNMPLVSPGDLIFSFCDTRIRALGTAIGRAQTTPKPDYGSVGDNWADEGWFIPVEFSNVEEPPRPKEFVSELRPFLAKKYAPIGHDGNGRQNVYLASISPAFAEVLLSKLGRSAAPLLSLDSEASVQEEAITGRTDIGETKKSQLIAARRGQGVFKANVGLNEQRCRVTGISDPRLLVASHIKPWSRCTDFEKLDGCNGLLLSPHIDKLFDMGLISFGDDGAILRSPKLSSTTMVSWGLRGISNVGPFKPQQCNYLRYHRLSVFKS